MISSERAANLLTARAPAIADRLVRLAGKVRNRHFLLADLLLLPAVAYLSFALRLGGWDLGVHWASCLRFMLLVTILGPLVFLAFGMYSRYWQHASVEDLAVLYLAVAVLDGVAIGILTVGSLWSLPGAETVARSIPVIFFLLAFVVVAGPRLLTRMAIHSLSGHGRGDKPLNTLIVGAGDAGLLTMRELRRNGDLDLRVVGFIDDAPAKQKLRIQGVPVLGDRHALPSIVARYGVQRVIIAMPAVPGRTIRELVAICERSGITPLILPGLYELIGGTVRVNQLRTVQIEDLLRRAPVQTDLAAVEGLLRGKRVLITGAGGSIGAELSRQVLRCRPAEIVLLGHGENSIFEVFNELQNLGRELGIQTVPKLYAVIADFRSRERLEVVFAQHRPQVVFHAGAHKHVPLMEHNPSEAVTNNVLGTQYLLEAARRVEVERFVLVSTDKAVNPGNVMGATKRVAELLVHRAARETERAYMAVRFGNVLGSRGSVVLSMKQQIAAGGPVTVTHPEMQRYFMTIPEAVQLVLQAAVLGRGGEVFLFDMGEPVRILDLAHDLIRLSGYEPDEEIEIVFTGLRPGEKLFEELFLPDEHDEPTAHEKIFIAASATGIVGIDLDERVAYLLDVARTGSSAMIQAALRLLVPEYDPERQHTVPPLDAATARRLPRPEIARAPAGERPRPGQVPALAGSDASPRVT